MMKYFVFWTGIYNVCLGVAFLFPAIPKSFGIATPESTFWLHLPATLVIFLGVLLVLCSRDLARRGSMVY